MDKTAALKRINSAASAVSDGAGGFTKTPTTVTSALRYVRWQPSAYVRQTLRSEHGLQANASLWNAAIEYSASYTPAERDWIVEDTTGLIFRIIGIQPRTNAANETHHWTALLVRLSSEPKEA